jgi:cytochrome c
MNLFKRKSFLPYFVASICLIVSCTTKRTGKPAVLVFSKTTSFRHATIPAGIEAIQKLGIANGFTVDTTENSAYFQEDSLKKYATIIFLNTSGNVLNHIEEIALERYIQSGGGFVGVHAAAGGIF